MERPRFVIGEIVDIVSPAPPEKAAEILGKEWHEIDEFAYTAIVGRRGWWYDVGNRIFHERNLRKRPDKREPFSIEALKEKYQPEPA